MSDNMKESLLSPDERDVTKPEAITMFDTVNEEKETEPMSTASSYQSNSQYIKPKRGSNARKRIDTQSDRFNADQSELRELMRQNSENVERRDKFIRDQVDMNLDETLAETNESLSVDLNLNGESIYKFRTTIDETAKKGRLPIAMSWRNITFKVMIKPDRPDGSRGGVCTKSVERTILNGINGDIQCGKLVAIMGPSGCGKTTLLNVISRRLVKKGDATLDGTIVINGVNRYELGKTFIDLTAFVQQDDVLFNQQTVYETLLTAAKFSSDTKNLKEKENLVESVLKELDLKHTRNTKIGDSQVRGVSGGERKRANIGTQMIRNPSLLFLDEPTSGLDSYQALKVVETLKKLCENGCTVVTSIHQPRSSIFTLFDEIVLLSKGNLVYMGPSGDDALKYFAEKGYVCPAYFNPADFFLDLVSVDTRSSSAEQKSKARIKFLCDEYGKEFANKTLRKYEYNNYSQEVITRTKDYHEEKRAKSIKVGKFAQLKTLAVRTFRQMLRDRRSFIIRIVMNIIFAIFISGVYSKTRGSKSQESINDREGVLFFMCILQSMGPIINTVQGFCLEKAIVMRERQTRSYSLGIYYLTTFIASLPIQVIFPVIFGSILYWIVGLNPAASRFLWFMGITILTNFSSIGLGFLCGCAAPSVEAATTIGQTLVALMILFSGFFIHVASLPVWLRWIPNLSTIRWSFMAFMINEFKDETGYVCDDDTSACFHLGSQVLDKFDFLKWDKATAVGLIAILLASFHILAFIMLKINRIRYMDVPKYKGVEKSYELAKVESVAHKHTIN